MTTPTTDALARGLYDRDRHEWALPDDAWESLRPHYVRDVERFLLPLLMPEPTGLAARACPEYDPIPPSVAADERNE